MLTDKLAGAFNDCADKIINAAELMRLSFAEYAAALSPEEREMVNSLKARTAEAINVETMAILVDEMKRRRLIAAVGDGTVGMYSCSKGQVFVNARFVRFMEESMRGRMQEHLPAALLLKLDAADASALIKAPDHKHERASLQLKPLI